MSEVHSTTLLLVNSTDRPMVIWLEPVGEELEFPPGARWQVTCESPSALLQPIEVAMHDNALAIHGTMNGVTRVIQGDTVLWECRLPFENAR